MDQGGNHLEVLFQSVKEKEFPNNLHEYYRKKLTEDWQKQVYDELLEAYNTKHLILMQAIYVIISQENNINTLNVQFLIIYI